MGDTGQASGRPAGATSPVAVNLDRDRRELQITWEDGHESRYPLSFLRKVCPCATCGSLHAERQKKGGLMVLPQAAAAASADLDEAHAVGRYALGFTWKDGHSTGIYTWDYLRDICPCPVCRAN